MSARRHFLNLPIVAISGKTGARLWTPETVDMEHDGTANADIWGVDVRDFDGDNQPEVLVSHDLHYTNAFASIPIADLEPPNRGRSMIRWEQAWLTLLSGRDGSVRWRCRLDPEHDETRIYPVETCSHAVADLNGDGTRDVVLAQLTTGDGVSWAYDLRALDGHSGAELWRHALDPPRRKEDVIAQPGSSQFFAEDIDGDGKAEVLIPEPTAQGEQTTGFPSLVLEGATGARRGQWHRAASRDSVKPGRVLARPGGDDGGSETTSDRLALGTDRERGGILVRERSGDATLRASFLRPRSRAAAGRHRPTTTAPPTRDASPDCPGPGYFPFRSSPASFSSP